MDWLVNSLNSIIIVRFLWNVKLYQIYLWIIFAHPNGMSDCKTIVIQIRLSQRRNSFPHKSFPMPQKWYSTILVESLNCICIDNGTEKKVVTIFRSLNTIVAIEMTMIPLLTLMQPEYYI